MRRTRRFAQAPYVSSFLGIHEVCVCWANRKAQRTSVVDTLSRNWYSAGWVVHVFNRRLFHYGMYDKLYLQVCYKVHACFDGKDRSNTNRIVSILIWYNKSYMKKDFRKCYRKRGHSYQHICGATNIGPSGFKRSFAEAHDTKHFESVVPFMDRQRLREYVSGLLVCRDVVYVKMPIVK